MILAALTLHAVISGAVYAPDGKPVPSVRLDAHRLEQPEEEHARLAAGMIERKAIASTTTDENGTFSLDTKSRGVFDLVVTEDGFLPHHEMVLQDEEGVGIVLQRASTRRGRVTANGKPVANALVTLVDRMDRSIGRVVRTDSEGAFAVPDPRREAASMVVLHPDFSPLEKPVETIPMRGTIELALVPGTSVAGKVVRGGSSVANARVIAGAWSFATSRDDGTFVLPHVADDVTSIEAVASTSFGSAKRAPKDVVITLAPARTISGTLRDANRQPLAGAVIFAWPMDPTVDEPRFSVAISDDKGNYRLDRCGPRQYQLSAHATGEVTFDEIGKVDLRRQTNGRQDFAANATPMLRGVVVDARKRPVGGARVTADDPTTPLMYAATPGSSGATTGPDGRFRLPAPARVLSLVALRAGYALGTAPTPDFSKGPPRSPVTITLPDGVEVCGIVTDEKHDPIAGAAILAVENPAAAMTFPLDALVDGGVIEPIIESGADGRFSIRLNRAPHDLVVYKNGYAAFRRGGMRPDGSALDVVLVRGVSIRGRVARKSGPQPHDGSVHASSADGTVRFAEIGPDATFVLESLAPGEYEVAYEGRDVESAPRAVRAPADDVVLELPSKGTIRGRVVDKATGAAISSYYVVVDTSDFASATDGQRASVTDGQPFTVASPIGVVKLIVTADGYVAESMDLKVEEQQPHDVTVTMTKGRTLRGHVASANGAPIADASLEFESEYSRIGVTKSDEDGDFEVNSLPRDSVIIAVTHERFVSKRVSVREEDTRIDIVLSAGRKVSGRVVTPGGQPAPQAYVSTSSAAHASDDRSASTGEDGAFAMEGLGEGRYTFVAIKEGFASATVEDVDIASGNPLVLTLGSERHGSGTIHGTVEGFTGSGAIFGAVIAQTNDGGTTQGIINRDGTYRVENVAAGEVDVRATATGIRGSIESESRTVTVAAGADVAIDLRFRTDITIRGIVTEDGVPAPGRKVEFNAKSGYGNWSDVTDLNGAYEIPAVAPGMYDVTVMSPRTAYKTAYEVASSATFDIRIEISVVEGRVVDESDAPVSGAVVAVSDRNMSAMTDAAGAFSIALPSGKYSLSARKNGFASRDVDAETGGAPLTITLVRADPLRVRVVDARDGTTLGGYVVAIGNGNVVVAQNRERALDGTTTLALTPGSYRIAASADGYATQSTRASVPATGEVRIALTPGGKLIIRSTVANAQIAKLVLPGGEEYVRCHCNGIAEIRLTGGTTVVEHVAPARYTLQLLDAKEKVVASASVSIVEAQVTTIEL